MLKTALLVVVSLYVLFAAVVYFFQEKFIFLGTPIPQNFTYEFDAPFEERSYPMVDGAVINALYFKARDPKGVILYSHGNGGELPRWGTVSYFFLELGYDVFVYDYRGYGKSTGERNETNLLSDAQTLYDELRRHWDEEQIVVYGRSLGSGLASYLAGHNKPGKLILETPFFSLKEMAARYFPFLPSSQLVSYSFPNAKNLAKTQPDLGIHIFHGTKDLVVPYEQGKKLHESIGRPTARFYTIAGANHNNLLQFKEYREAIRVILGGVASGESAVDQTD